MLGTSEHRHAEDIGFAETHFWSMLGAVAKEALPSIRTSLRADLTHCEDKFSEVIHGMLLELPMLPNSLGNHGTTVSVQGDAGHPIPQAVSYPGSTIRGTGAVGLQLNHCLALLFVDQEQVHVLLEEGVRNAAAHVFVHMKRKEHDAAPIPDTIGPTGGIAQFRLPPGDGLIGLAVEILLALARENRPYLFDGFPWLGEHTCERVPAQPLPGCFAEFGCHT
mmetsp:Transcript_53027/g.113868  ORF Transcript_53027/g.113868 Transcript_53027/m.113868 type:complete len:221 (-) Transcript_53027:1380-2042(-)